MKFKLLLLFLLIPQFASAYYTLHPCCSRLQACGWWSSAEYLLLCRKARFFPPLVTTNPTTLPLLSEPGTEVLFGDKTYGGSPKSGGRFDFGIWISRCLGVGTGFFILCDDEIKFNIDGNAAGFPILGLPFFNTAAGVQDVFLISFPGIASNGHIDIESNNRLWGYDLYLRYRLLCSRCFKFDFLGGFLASHLQDNFSINSNTTLAGPTMTAISDNFSTENEYIAGLVGLYAELRGCSWAFTLTGKVGVGCMNKTVKIDGTTTTTFAGVTTVTTGGLLTQPSNIGEFKNKKFEVVPQINASVQLKITPHVWLIAGYTYIFWPAVVLAGEQISLNINPTQVPGPTVGDLAPIFKENLTSFWVQGASVGLYFCY